MNTDGHESRDPGVAREETEHLSYLCPFMSLPSLQGPRFARNSARPLAPRTLLFALAIIAACSATAFPAVPLEVARELDTRRLHGTGYYENGDFKAAAAEFRRAIELDRDSAADRFNLALVLTRAARYEEALQMLAQAERRDPQMLGVPYIRGIIYKRQAKYAAAAECLDRVVSADRRCWGAYYNLGVCHKYLRSYKKAKEAFQAAAAIDPTHPSTYYQLITLARRTGDVEEAKRYAEIYDQIKETVDESEKTVEALERSKYSYVLPSPRLTADVSPDPQSPNRFVDATAAAGLPAPANSPSAHELPSLQVSRKDYSEQFARERYVPLVGGAIALDDCDSDGDLDIYVVVCAADAKVSANRLYRNKGDGRFVDVTAEAGVADDGMGTDAVFGDYDNDGHNDIYVVNYGPNVLYHNQGDGTFEDVSEEARVNEPQFGRQAAFVDYDHDNDLDILVVNDTALDEPPKAEQFTVPEGFVGQVNTLLRNNGDGKFTDQTDEAGLLVDCSQSRSLVFADFDADHDVDVFICNADSPSLLFANSRLGKLSTKETFTPPIQRAAVATAEGDFDRDGDADLLVAVDGVLYLYKNAGKSDFTGSPLLLPGDAKITDVTRIDVLDYNNDGSIDLLLLAGPDRSLRLLAGAGSGQFRDVTAASGLAQVPRSIGDVATGDLDGDGDQDILATYPGGDLRLLRNDGDTVRHWIDVRLVGKKVNRDGCGACVEIAAGGHYQRQTARGGRIHFGLGSLDEVDILRVVWPNGVAQNVIRPKLDGNLDIVQEVKISASCAMLWTYNGTGFELVNEILGVGALGVPKTPGVYHQPDCTELTKIESHQLAPQEGIYELRLTEELREITFADQIALRVVDHPAGLEIVPNEMFTTPPFPEDKLFAPADRQVPRSATDDRGRDVLDLVRQRDGRFPTFPLTRYDGLAQPHALTLDLGDLSGAERIVLYLDGWIFWPESSTVMAVAQDSRFELAPLSLSVRDRDGRWQTAIESVGLPTSKGTVVPVDLVGRFPGNDYHVRLATNMCVYFDRIFVATRDEASRCRVTELPVARADLRYRGFSRMTRDRFGFERFHYADPSPFGSWNPPQGRFTRYGDVTPLLTGADNMFVIFAPGDELALRFDGRRLPELPPGWVRDFVFYANGWVKDGDLNTAFSQRVDPLPFHGMSGYPYRGERYPSTGELKRYRRTYNNRDGACTVGRLRAR